MDKRIIIVTVCFLSISLSFFLVKKLKGNEAFNPTYAVSLNQVNAGDSVVFTDFTPGASRWTWDFGDREYGDKQKMSHIYLSPGTYTVKLTVTTASGSAKDSSKQITVVAKATEPTVVETPPVAAEPEPEAHSVAAPPKPKKQKHQGGGDDLELPNVMGASEVKEK